MVDDRRWVIASDHQASGFENRRCDLPWRMDLPIVERLQLREIAPDELAVRVETMRLRDGVEDAEIRLRVAAGGRGPLPAAVVGGEVVIDQRFGEVALAPAPVDEQVLD